MKLPPAVMIHGLDHASAALAPGLPVTLLSGPGAALYAGAGWWRALVAAASAGAPPPPNILDCGQAAGRALEALRAGQILLVLDAPDAIFAEVAALCVAKGATLFKTPPRSLDLAQHGAARHLMAWLEQPETHPSG